VKSFSVFLLLAAFTAAALYFSRPALSEEGERTYYYQASSSFGVSEVKTTDSFKVKAESVFVQDECDLNGILKKYKARVIFTESVGNAVSYYCYSTKLSGGVLIRGRQINLHVAVADYGYTVATPIAFGCY